MVLIDSTILLFFLDPKTPAPLDPNTGKLVSNPEGRINVLINKLQKEGTKIVVPTPVLSEILVIAGTAGPSYLSILEKTSVFRIAPFDIRAAVEVAAMAQRDRSLPKKLKSSVATWAKVKYDRQIVAIGKTLGTTAIYSDDNDLKALAKAYSIEPSGIADLPLPPEDPQTSLLEHL